MSKIVNLNEKSRFYFKVESVRYVKENDVSTRTFDRAVILLVDRKTNKDIIHPFTDFIYEKYRGKKIKTQIDYANKVSTFLNFILKSKSSNKKFKSFSQLKYDDASEFLDYLSISCQRETVERYKRILSKFYYFLANRRLLFNCKAKDFEIIKTVTPKGKVIEVINAPFPEFDMPEATDRKRNQHDLSLELQALLLEIAFEEVNPIALGLALQMFGGLRVGEVVNLTYSAISTIGPFGRFGLSLNLEDRDLRPELKNNQGKGHVKRPRNQQSISPFGIIEILFRAHQKRYKALDGSDAVFVNNDGKSMTYGSYLYYFSVLKKKFLDTLSNSTNPMLKAQALVLKSKRWSTHIGRGIFSNNLVEIVDNSTEFQVQRGDKNKESGSVYLADSKRLGEKFEQNTEEVFIKLLDKFNKK